MAHFVSPAYALDCAEIELNKTYEYLADLEKETQFRYKTVTPFEFLEGDRIHGWVIKDNYYLDQMYPKQGLPGEPLGVKCAYITPLREGIEYPGIHRESKK